MEWNEYILRFLKIILEFFEHRIIHIILVVLLIIAGFVWKSHIKILLKWPHERLIKIRRFFLSKLHRNHAKCIIQEEARYIKIRKDIQSAIENLKLINDADKRFTSVQYLLEYPSPNGFIALMELAVSLNDHESRTKLICDMCQSSTEFKWYVNSWQD